MMRIQFMRDACQFIQKCPGLGDVGAGIDFVPKCIHQGGRMFSGLTHQSPYLLPNPVLVFLVVISLLAMFEPDTKADCHARQLCPIQNGPGVFASIRPQGICAERSCSIEFILAANSANGKWLTIPGQTKSGLGLFDRDNAAA
jgi:hypothetical protein